MIGSRLWRLSHPGTASFALVLLCLRALGSFGYFVLTCMVMISRMEGESAKIEGC